MTKAKILILIYSDDPFLNEDNFDDCTCKNFILLYNIVSQPWMVVRLLLRGAVSASCWVWQVAAAYLHPAGAQVLPWQMSSADYWSTCQIVLFKTQQRCILVWIITVISLLLKDSLTQSKWMLDAMFCRWIINKVMTKQHLWNNNFKNLNKLMSAYRCTFVCSHQPAVWISLKSPTVSR